MTWRFSKVEEQRKELIEAYIKGNITMTELGRRYGISRKTAYKWYNRYVIDDFADSALRDKSKAPHNPYTVFKEEQIQLLIDLKTAHKDWGPKKLLAILKRDFPDVDWPCATRLYEILKEHYLVNSRKKRKRVPATHPLKDLNNSNDVWLADFKGWFMTQNNEKCEPLTITDGFSRYLIRCEHVSEKSVKCIWPIFEDAFKEFGLPIRIRTDNGCPFGSTGAGRLTRLSVNFIKAGVVPEWIKPGHPEENGRHERFHLTLKQSVATPSASNLKEQIARMQAFQIEYNSYRPHEALQMKTPSNVYVSSARQWDGILRAPEYDSKKMEIRKVSSNGCISIKKVEHYIGDSVAGEYVGLEEDDDEQYNVYYGPVYLGKLGEKRAIEKPKAVVSRKFTKR